MFHKGQQLGEYALIKKLGKGGFGEVWLAENKDGLFAVKLPHKDQVDWKTITQEIGLWTLCGKHPNVMPLVGARNFNGQIAIISEYAPDGSLEDLLRAKGKLSVEEAALMTIGILEGLQHLHESGIIHRDLKPANILLDGNLPRLTDFGISRIISADSLSETIAGTFAYMAPECFDGKRNVQTDIWAVGVILYRMLAGTLPFPRKEQTALIGSIIMSQPEDLPNEMNPFVRKIASSILLKTPSDRPEILYLLSEFRGYIEYIDRKLTHLKTQESVLKKQLIPYRKGEKWGFCNAGKSIVIQPKYDLVTVFSDGLAGTKSNGKCAFIDENGKIIIPLKYDGALAFENGIAVVGYTNPQNPVSKKRLGAINRTGIEIIPCEYENVISHGEVGFVKVYLKHKCGVFGRKGKELLPCKYDEILLLENKLFKARLDDRFGLFDENGNVLAECKYDFIDEFRDGLSTVILEDKIGFIDEQGIETIPCSFEKTNILSNGVFSEGLAAVSINGKTGFIDKQGVEIIPFIYDSASEFHDGLAGVRINEKWGFVNKSGGMQIEPSFTKIDFLGGFSKGLAAVSINNKWGAVDKLGDEVIPMKYEFLGEFREGVASMGLFNKCGLIDRNGNEIIPCKYDAIWSFHEGLARVKLSNKEGLIDKYGNEIVDCKFDSISNFKGGFAKIQVAGRTGLINKEGDIIASCKYDDVDDFHEGFAAIRLDWKFGCLDSSGKEVIPCKYDFAPTFKNDIAYVKIAGIGGYIGNDGTEYFED